MSVADSISECVDGIEFHYFNTDVNFTRAQVICGSLSGELVSVEDEVKYDKVIDFYDKTDGPVGARFWIGLEGTGNDPTTFIWSNGIGNQTFYEQEGKFPWREARPNGNHVHSCVAIRTTNKLFQDLSCSTNNVDIICQIPCSLGNVNVTENPTYFPTTKSPTTETPTTTPKAMSLDSFLNIGLTKGTEISLLVVTIFGVFVVF